MISERISPRLNRNAFTDKLGLPLKFAEINSNSCLVSEFRAILNEINSQKDGISSFPLSCSFLKVAVYSFDHSQVWASDIGKYWMDIDSEGISMEVLDDDSCQIFISFEKLKNYSLSQGINLF